MPALPVTVIGGYLGAGKTTLVNHLLRHASPHRLGVLVNDFGELPIDADLIQGQEGDLLSIAGGCVCCSYGSELMDALISLPRRAPGLTHLLVEASGVALPGAVASAVSLVPHCARDAVVVLADATNVRERGTDRYVADTVTRQLAAADLVFVSKGDLVEADALAAVMQWIAPQVRTGVAVLPMSRGRVPADLVLGLGPSDTNLAGPPAQGLARWRRPFPSIGHEVWAHEAAQVVVETPVDPWKLASGLADPALGLVRVKGFVCDPQGRWVTLQLVGPRVDVQPAPQAIQGPGRLVLISVGGRVPREAIERRVAAAAA